MSTRLAVALSPALAVLALAVASAPAAASDASATQAYVQADFSLVNTAAGRIPKGESILQSVLAGVRRECPKAAAGSPQNPESTALSNEVIGAMVTAAIHPILGPIRQYLQ